MRRHGRAASNGGGPFLAPPCFRVFPSLRAATWRGLRKGICLRHGDESPYGDVVTSRGRTRTDLGSDTSYLQVSADISELSFCYVDSRTKGVRDSRKTGNLPALRRADVLAQDQRLRFWYHTRAAAGVWKYAPVN